MVTSTNVLKIALVALIFGASLIMLPLAVSAEGLDDVPAIGDISEDDGSGDLLLVAEDLPPPLEVFFCSLNIPSKK
jgi:hypothetical protein